ncbi:GNAT family N-acetyltransferase [Streptomyces sp. NPDC015232]|uniref:GNAT family N-acetyltransferase n=1 Tax=unclassified Streptomyces TaxID=2593676 RepID=UPI0036FE7191
MDKITDPPRTGSTGFPGFEGFLEAAATASAPALLLRPWAPDDAPALIAPGRDAEVRRWTSMAVDDEAGAAAWIREQRRGWDQGTRFAFAVLEHADRGGPARVAGHAVLKRTGPGAASGEVGYWTAPHARGRGVAARSLAALTDWAFATFAADGLSRLELLHQAGNAASCRVAEKGGYALAAIRPAAPPTYPQEGHVHVREHRG